MRQLATAITATLIISISSTAHSAAGDIDDKINTAQSRYEILDSLGLRCDGYLRTLGTKGIEKEPCQKFLKNLTSGFLQDTAKICHDIVTLLDADARKPDAASNQQLIRAMKACTIKNYPYIIKTHAKIKNLQELE